ncbi:TlpA family protein disulfide reductase [bacterium]|nr:MAG: TlpA family protein disulfide reductase [bacterium]
MIRLRPLLLALTIAAAALLARRMPVNAAAAPQPRAAAPAFTLPLAGGRGSISLAQFKGHPVYLNYFASWCQPCNDEAPDLKKIAQEYRSKGLVFIGIDELESSKKAQQFAHKYGLPYRIAIDDDGSVGARYGVVGLPVQVLIGADGRIVFDQPGPINPAALRGVLKRVLAAR